MGTFLEKEEFINWMMSTNHILKNTLSTQKKQFKETLKKKIEWNKQQNITRFNENFRVHSTN